jgi:endonuclease-3
MSSLSRTALFSKLHKVLKKSYHPVEPDPNRPVLEQLLYGCLLENAHYAATEEAYAALVHGFYDWNEIRVSSVRELAEVMSGLPDPPAAATRLKRILQTVFEATYSFDLEELRKLNLGQAVERLRKIEGGSEFALAYVVQATLGGHAIPVDRGALGALRTVDLVDDKNVKDGVVPGLERAIAKSKGVEFGSLLHQLGADFVADPFSTHLREILVQVDPIADERLPKRRVKRRSEALTSAPPDAPSPAAAKPDEPPAPAVPDLGASASPKPAEKAAPRKKKAEDSASAPSGQDAQGAVDSAPAEPAREDKPSAGKKKPAERKGAPANPLPTSEPESTRPKADPAEVPKRKPR